MSRSFQRLALLFAAIGLAASGGALYVHYHLLTQPGYASPCDVNATVGCSQAYLSRYGSLFGVPVALFGFLWFAFVAVLIIVGSRAPAPVQENVPAYLFTLSTIGLAVVLYLAYAAFFVLKELCLFCLATYTSVIALFVVSAVATSIPLITVPRRIFRDLRVLALNRLAVVVVALFAAGSASAISFFPREGRSVGQRTTQSAALVPGSQQSDFEKWFRSLPRETVAVSNAGAAVLIVKFNDYQCAPCSASYFDLGPVLAKFEADMPGAVKLVLKDFPWDQSCNAYVPRTLHAAACTAAVAVRMAEQHRRRAEMEDYLYTNQATLTPASVQQAARRIGHVDDWNQGWAAALSAVKTDIALARTLRIHETPTFFINGIRLPRALSPQGWDLAIRLELKRAGTLK